MGQYHMVYNVDKKEYFRADMLKLWEQVGVRTSTTALFMLVANSNGRGGGDFNDHDMIGRWAGDRIVVQDRKSTRLNSSHSQQSRMPSSA